jgi:CRP-like cAMP-binding protein
MATDDIQKALLGCEFFKELQPDQIASIIPLCRMHRFAAGETVYRQGDTGEFIFIVAEGAVVLERASSVGTRRGAVAMAILGKGRVLGGWSTLLNEPHTLMLSAVCQKPAALVALRGADLRRLMISDVRLGFGILEKLCFLLRDRVQLAIGAMENI